MSSAFAKKFVICFIVVTGVSVIAQARDHELLNKALAVSSEERTGVEREYKKNDATIRKGTDLTEIRAISVELGDELGAEGGANDNLKFHDKNRVFRERAVSSKLDREWKDVNRGMRETPTRVSDHGSGHSAGARGRKGRD
jgi:hypothetical protein